MPLYAGNVPRSGTFPAVPLVAGLRPRPVLNQFDFPKGKLDSRLTNGQLLPICSEFDAAVGCWYLYIRVLKSEFLEVHGAILQEE